MRARTPNARFWVYVNGGPVKLTLRPGQSLSWERCGSTEEGWSSESVCWDYCGDTGFVFRAWVDDGRDCDGRMTNAGEDECALADLMSGNEPYLTDAEQSDPETVDCWRGVVWPAWQERGRRQYDEYAEAAGY